MCLRVVCERVIKFSGLFVFGCLRVLVKIASNFVANNDFSLVLFSDCVREERTLYIGLRYPRNSREISTAGSYGEKVILASEN